MTISEASKRLGIKPDTLYRKVKARPEQYGAKKIEGMGRGFWILDGRKIK